MMAGAAYAGGITFYYNPRGRLVLSDLDAFGNKVRARRIHRYEYHAEILCCLAGRMTQAQLNGGPRRAYVSGGDLRNARWHRRQLGKAAKSWPAYEAETRELVKQHWPMIEAVAKTLLRKKVLTDFEVDSICQRIARLHLKRGRAGR
jgi:hypothetical protein